MFWRKQKRNQQQVGLSPSTELQVDEGTIDPAEWICKSEAHDLVREAMQKLAAEDREILMLKHVEGWTYEQISDCLEITYDKVVYRISRARDRLRKQLANSNFKDHE